MHDIMQYTYCVTTVKQTMFKRDRETGKPLVVFCRRVRILKTISSCDVFHHNWSESCLITAATIPRALIYCRPGMAANVINIKSGKCLAFALNALICPYSADAWRCDDITLDTPAIHLPIYVNVLVAYNPMPNISQVISNHHADWIVSAQ